MVETQGSKVLNLTGWPEEASLPSVSCRRYQSRTWPHRMECWCLLVRPAYPFLSDFVMCQMTLQYFLQILLYSVDKNSQSQGVCESNFWWHGWFLCEASAVCALFYQKNITYRFLDSSSMWLGGCLTVCVITQVCPSTCQTGSKCSWLLNQVIDLRVSADKMWHSATELYSEPINHINHSYPGTCISCTWLS